VTGAKYVLTRKKRIPLYDDEQKTKLLHQIRLIDFVSFDGQSTAEALERLRPLCYVKGIDWLGALPAPQSQFCSENDILILFLDCVTNSSSSIVQKFVKRLHDD
jgi:bifunctional ADP-heptose synthase (sugar kinase/adenylyltransferase)